MNRRDFLQHLSAYLAVTAATCGHWRTASAHLPEQGSSGSSRNGSGWPEPSGKRTSVYDDIPADEYAGFQLEGCSLSGNLTNQFRFILSSGNPRIDQATVNEVRNLINVTGLYPSFAFLDDRESKNAFAIRQDIITGRSPHGAVAVGIRLIQDFLTLPALNRFNNDLCIQAALVHEWAHIGQFVYGVQASHTKYTELMADFMAGWFIGYKETAMGWQTDVSSAMLGMFSLGDTNFNSPGHHGTPRERLEAYTSGVVVVRQARSAGYLYGGGYGLAQVPDFRTAFQFAAQTYIR